MEPLIFIPSQPFTIGVELEFQLLDVATLDLAPRAPQLLAQLPAGLRGEIKPEFMQSMVEVSTPVCQDMQETASELAILCRTLEELAAGHDCVPFAASLHPFARLKERHIYPGARYSQIMHDLQLAGRRLITQALHVHIGLPDEQTALKVCNGIREHLPTLLALTTSSPFIEGEDSGFYSYRTNLFKALPRSGIPETLESWHHFQELIELLNEATLLQGIKELWWDVRPHPDFGTVEIRVCDLPSRFNEVLAMAALCQALVAHLASRESTLAPYREIMLNNKWHASRYGLEGIWIATHHGGHRPFAQAAAALIEMVTPTAQELEGREFLEPLVEVLANGTSAHRQRHLYARTRDFRAVIETLRQDFWK
ncbi:MAG: YbdK family carboxylate-amine ligase [Deltaproteobacteria bacterium]|jgi:carboxylate-amine ligase